MERETIRQNPKHLAFYQMKKESALKMLRNLWIISHLIIPTMTPSHNVSIDMDLVITPTQAHVHWHCELNKKRISQIK
jgi:hypothetical protein